MVNGEKLWKQMERTRRFPMPKFKAQGFSRKTEDRKWAG
jgi:hypothetical protein